MGRHEVHRDQRGLAWRRRVERVAQEAAQKLDDPHDMQCAVFYGSHRALRYNMGEVLGAELLPQGNFNLLYVSRGLNGLEGSRLILGD